MESSETPQQHGGIFNYFQGATINNLVINGTMHRNGTEYYQGKSSEKKGQRPKCTDQQIAQALTEICGKGQVLSNYQLWLGACCLLMGKYGFPKDLEQCCERITKLPYDDFPALECKYENIRKFSYFKFVREDVDRWDEYQPRAEEQRLFDGCRVVAQELDKKLTQ